MASPRPSTHYTHAPPLRRNALTGSLQLLFWLFIHPSAWRNYIARLDSQLRPDFYLAELNAAHWRNSQLRQLLIKGFVVWPLLVGVIVWLTGLAGAGQLFGKPQSVISGLAIAVAMCLAISLSGGLLINVATGIVGGVAGSLAFSLVAVLPDGLGRTSALVMMAGLVLGIIGSVAYSAASPIPGSRAGHPPGNSIGRQVVGIILGILMGIISTVVVSSLTISLVSRVDFQTARNLVFGVAGGDLVNVARGITFGAAGGVATGIAVGRRTNRWRELIFGITAGVLLGLGSILAGNAASEIIGIVNAALLVALFALCYVLAERMAGPWGGGVAGALGSGSVLFLSVIGNYGRWPILPLGVVCITLGLTLAWWRPVLFYPALLLWNMLLYNVERNAVQRQSYPINLLPYHAAFWDEYQRLPFFQLDNHLLLNLTTNPATGWGDGQAALNFLTSSPQRWAAQSAQIALDARALQACPDVTAIANVQRTLVAGELSGPASALLRSFSRLSQDVAAALGQESVYHQRLAFSAVEERLDGLLRELTRSSEPYAERFRPVVLQWQQVIGQHTRYLAAAVEARQELDNPYIIGVPLTEQQAIFTGRTSISARIEQLLRDHRRPPLLLYGQRRMGKTSLLNNLGRLLPGTIVPLFVDLQGATRADDHAGLLYNMARDMAKSAEQRRDLRLPGLTRAALASDPFTTFGDWLDGVEQQLTNRQALLALDEFETLDNALAKGRYAAEDVLGMLRHLIQHRPKFKVLLAGSHTLAELEQWAGYLINVQVVQLGYLQEAEARQLIERPVADFALRYEPDASQRVLHLTNGHPFLIQLLCAEIVALKNEQPPALRRQAALADVEAAVPEALNSGSFFFADIQRNQVDAAGLRLLQWLAAQGEGAVANRQTLAHLLKTEDAALLDPTLAQLCHRQLLTQVDNGYRFEVELIRRWFAR